MFEKLSQNLNLLMSEIRISADELGRRTGIPPSTIKKIRNCYNPNPTLSTLLPLADFFCITIGQLAGYEPLPSNRIKGIHKSIGLLLHNIPIINWNDVPYWPHNQNAIHDFIVTEQDYNENSYALIVEDEDWENLIRGSALIVDPTIKPEHRDYAIILKEGQPTPALRQILIDDERIYLKPVTAGFKIISHTNEYAILGTVVEYKKYLKQEMAKQIEFSKVSE